MVKRYTSGVMGAVPTNSYGILSGGMYGLAQQAQYNSTTQWPQTAPPITYLVVGGGGGGGRNNGGGGGAGGVLTNISSTSIFLAKGQTYTVVVGAGGTGQNTNSVQGNNGTNSILLGVGKNTSTTNTYAGFFSGTVAKSATKYYCTLPANTAFSLGSGNFTIEGWFYVSGAGSQYPVGNWRTVVSTRATNSTSGTTAFACGIDPNGGVYFYTNTLEVNTGVDLGLLNKWAHIAWVRNGTTITVYVNGVSVGTGTSTDNLTVNTMSIGGNLDGSESWEGLMSNLRIVKGVAVYTGNFAVPNMPLTSTQSAGTNISAITAGQCSLLTLQNSTIIDNSGNNFVVTQVGTIFVLPYGNNYVLINAIGGGVGGGYGAAPANGGSGGGAGPGAANASGRPGQGNDGGTAVASTGSPYAAAGGGGAGAGASAATSSSGTIGGIGVYSTLAGTFLAGGGSGCGYTTAKNPSDGGGTAAGLTSGDGSNGTANTGGGGGGAAYNGTGGTGGSGIVIISFPSFYANATATTGSPTVTQSGGNTIYKFTGSGSITF